jgi:hypothetical protein
LGSEDSAGAFGAWEIEPVSLLDKVRRDESAFKGWGGALGGTLALSGISMAMSKGKGLGCVSNTKGNPMTAKITNTAEPISRCLTRFLKDSML